MKTYSVQFALLALVCAFNAFARPTSATVIRCEGEYEGKPEVIRLKIGKSGKFVKWDAKRMAAADPESAFLTGFAEDLQEYGYEWIKNLRGRNGAVILEMGTTADSFKIAVSADLSNATFEYRDHGSGAGNHRFELVCETLAP